MKALIVASVASMIDQFNKPNIKLLQKLGYEVAVACNFFSGNTCTDEKIAELKLWLQQNNIRYFQIDFSRDIKKVFQNKTAYRQLKQIATNDRYDIVHCHSPIGGVLGRMVFHNSKAKVVYTAHGFHFYKGAPLLNWLLYFPVEWVCSFMTDTLITINKEDYAFAKKHLHAKQAKYVHGIGMDLEKFSKRITAEEKEKLRAELGIKLDDKLILSIGELSIRKNHETVIRALAEIKDKRIRYAIAGKGTLTDHLQQLAMENGVNLRLLGFRTDISALCNIADIFIFPSLQEGLPVALMEAIACKTPVICSDIRGNIELVAKENLFALDDTKQLAKMIKNGVADWTVEANYENLQKFGIENVMREMEAIYGCKTEQADMK